MCNAVLSPLPCKAAAPKGPAFCFLNYFVRVGFVPMSYVVCEGEPCEGVGQGATHLAIGGEFSSSPVVRGGRCIEVPYNHHRDAGVLIGDLSHRRRQLGTHELFVVRLRGRHPI